MDFGTSPWELYRQISQQSSPLDKEPAYVITWLSYLYIHPDILWKSCSVYHLVPRDRPNWNDHLTANFQLINEGTRQRCGSCSDMNGSKWRSWDQNDLDGESRCERLKSGGCWRQLWSYLRHIRSIRYQRWAWVFRHQVDHYRLYVDSRKWAARAQECSQSNILWLLGLDVRKLYTKHGNISISEWMGST